MKWNKYRLATTTEAVDLISYTLAEMGIEGIEIEDKVPLSEEDKQKMFIDLLPELDEDDGKAFVSFYIEPEKDHDTTLEEVLAAVKELADFVDIGEATIEKTQTEDIDWMNNWKKYWKPFNVDEHIIIKPTWETLEDVPEDTLVVEIDPGTAFGTGTHHTTRLCITQVNKYMQNDMNVLDVGCGSGILSIIALLRGAKKATATDLDILAVDAAIENAQVNGIKPEDYTVLQGNVITDEAFRHQVGEHAFDMVVANIFAEIIIPLSDVVKEMMKPGALFITSGIIDEREEDVRAALIKNGFEIMEVTHSGGWVSFTARA